jgi:hypothetical protein
MLPIVQAAVEGFLDEAVVRRLIVHAGGEAGTVYGRNGKPALRKGIKGYNNAAQFTPWVVVVDLDNDAACAPPLRTAWVPTPAPHLCFRIAVREIEAWLMADKQTLASYLRIRTGSVPEEPERLQYPKDVMVNLARHSRSRDIRSDMVPRENSGRRVGPAYASRLIEYVQGGWRPEVAAQRSESLRRAIHCVRMLVKAVVR